MKERQKDPLLHHKVREFDTQKKVFEQLTVASTVLSDPQTGLPGDRPRAARALALQAAGLHRTAARHGRRSGHSASPPPEIHERSDPRALRAALAEAEAMINRARQAGDPGRRRGASFRPAGELVKLAEKTNIPVAATLLGKSVIGEHHPFYLGVYEGAMGREDVRQYVESSDCVILLGFFMTDINLGVFTARLDPSRCIRATSEKMSVRYHNYENVRFKDFMRGLLRLPLRRRGAGQNLRVRSPTPASSSAGQAQADHRQAAVPAPELVSVRGHDGRGRRGRRLVRRRRLVHPSRTEFLGPAYYASMGFAVPASVGAQLANPKLRPLVLVGDGAFQMTGMELATVARYGLNPIVVVLEQRGYGTERHMQDGPYNDLWPWQYHRLPEVLGAGGGFDVRTEEELDNALHTAKADKTASV